MCSLSKAYWGCVAAESPRAACLGVGHVGLVDNNVSMSQLGLVGHPGVCLLSPTQDSALEGQAVRGGAAAGLPVPPATQQRPLVSIKRTAGTLVSSFLGFLQYFCLYLLRPTVCQPWF